MSEQPLCIIFNISINTKCYPNEWKKSFITPIYKNGDKESINNYSPISIICGASKIFEKILLKYIQNETDHLIVNQQHGFISKKSTVSNLAEFSEFVTNNMNRGGQVDTIYTDFAKAFDSVNYSILIEKLKRLNISNCMLSLLKSFLANRKQIVCMNGLKSRTITPTSSVQHL